MERRPLAGPRGPSRRRRSIVRLTPVPKAVHNGRRTQLPEELSLGSRQFMIQARLQKVGGFMAGMVVPNIGADRKSVV